MVMKYFYSLLLCCFLLVSCKNEAKKDSEEASKPADSGLELNLKTNPKGETLIRELVEKAGGEKRETATVNFDSNPYSYQIIRNCGQFDIERNLINKRGDTVVLKLGNLDITKTINQKIQKLSDTTAARLKQNLRSKIYFTEIPFGLNAPGIRKKFLGEEEIDGKSFAKVKIAFIENRGSKPFLDQYVFWVDQESKTLTYLATTIDGDQNNLQFRKVENPRVLKGIRFVDYQVYQPEKHQTIALRDLAQAFEKGELKRINTDKITNIEVEISERDCD